MFPNRQQVKALLLTAVTLPVLARTTDDIDLDLGQVNLPTIPATEGNMHDTKKSSRAQPRELEAESFTQKIKHTARNANDSISSGPSIADADIGDVGSILQVDVTEEAADKHMVVADVGAAQEAAELTRLQPPSTDSPGKADPSKPIHELEPKPTSWLERSIPWVWLTCMTLLGATMTLVHFFKIRNLRRRTALGLARELKEKLKAPDTRRESLGRALPPPSGGPRMN